MIEDLSNELSRVISVYRNRSDLFRWNGKKTAFSTKDVVRHHLFTKAESCGFTPVPKVSILQWEIDLVCLRQLRPEYIFVIRENKKEDYRQLLLFPRTIEKVLICLVPSAVPDNTEGLNIVRLTKKPTEVFKQGMTIKRVVDDYKASFREVYGFEPTYSSSQLIGSAAKVSMFWVSSAQDLNFKEYCIWYMSTKLSRNVDDEMEKMTTLYELINKTALSAFRISKRGSNYDDKWVKDGWKSFE